MKRFLTLFVLVITAAVGAPSYDIVVYGGTSGGVVAAVQAARSGRSVVLISPTAHLGGLTTSGLGWTDLGGTSILGGISKEFYHSIYLHYQNDAAWNWQTRASFGNAGQGGPAFNASSQTASVFEPKVAESIFNSMLAAGNVPVVTGRIDLNGGVINSGGRIDRLRLEDGREFSGRMFIDASYEGDLLPGAGVTFTTGREANAAQGETSSGIQTARAVKNQLRSGIDPYVIPGNPQSGLLPGVNPDAGGVDGSADTKLQAYCFRMVLTDVASNRVSIAKPPGYNEADYELLFRSIEAGQTSGFFKFDLMPNRKTDSNNDGGISTDFIGRNYGPGWDWTTLGHDQRLAVAKQHENWQRGLLWTLQNHPRVPASIRSAYASWGLPADEFTDNDHWPWQIYVREARRMVSGFVMSERNCNGTEVAPDSIGLAAYSMDSHNVQRQVVNGMVRNEGDVQVAVANPYPVSYRAIVPKAGECPNLFVPWSLSATHMAFGSIRMEPVFMTLSQSAAIAADLAIAGNYSAQQLPYTKLRPALVAAGQALGEATAGAPTVIVDNDNATLVTVAGNWTAASTTAGYTGVNYLHNGNTGQGISQVAYTVPAGLTGTQRVFLRWTSHVNRASNVPVEILHAGGTTVVTVDQRSNGGKWNLLGFFSGVQRITIKTTGTNGYVVADAVGFSTIGEADDSDGDGTTDLQEIALGLDPLVSNRPFFDAVRNHPDYFDLHKDDEIFDMWIRRPSYSPATFRFNLEDGFSPAGIENFQLPVPQSGKRQFYRVALQSSPSAMVTALAAGKPRKAVVYGTSLTANGAWVAQMSAWLSATYTGQLTVINSGLSGKNSTEGLSQLQTKVIANHPDTVFIEFATNDAFLYSDGTPSLSVAQARSNLEAMIDAILGADPKTEIILQTMNPAWDSPSGSNASASLRPNLATYYAMYRTVAQERGLRLIDYQPDWESLRQSDPTGFRNFVPDGLHPTAAGCSAVILPLLKWKLSGGQPKR